MLHEQQQTISMRSNVWERTHVLLMNTKWSHLYSFSATGESSGLATRVTLKAEQSRSNSVPSHGAQPPSSHISNWLPGIPPLTVNGTLCISMSYRPTFLLVCVVSLTNLDIVDRTKWRLAVRSISGQDTKFRVRRISAGDIVKHCRIIYDNVSRDVLPRNACNILRSNAFKRLKK
jgi:hypothetical protein